MPLSESESEFIRQDHGVLRESLTDSRVMLLGCSAYRSMCDALYEQFQSGGGVILYRMGEGYGRKLASSIPLADMSREDAIQVFQKLALLAGWGDIKIKILDQKTAECIVHKSPFVLHRKDAGRVSCYFLSGVLSAIASALFTRKFTTREVLCEMSGSAVCKFLVTEEP
jgi:predicted hydrocarbon binding protein